MPIVTTAVLQKELDRLKESIKQMALDGPRERRSSYDYLIKQWAGRYISRSDVDVAAFMHPDIKGGYPLYNIEKNLTKPSKIRLRDLSTADTLGYESDDQVSVYSHSE